MSFEEKLQRLNEIIDEIDQGEVSIDQSLSLYEEAVGLAEQANDVLACARQKVSILQDQVMKPFRPLDTEEKSDDD